jgi:hypothetical protein
MKQKKYTYIILIITLFFSQYSHGIKNKANRLELVGSSTFSVLLWDIYDVSLYTANGDYVIGQVPITIELNYLRDIKRRDLIAETKSQWERFELEALDKKRWLEQLKKIWPNVKEQDTIAFQIDDQHDTRFYFNNAFIGKIEGKKFSYAFSMIWLDSNGPYPKMTRQLIGRNNSP